MASARYLREDEGNATVRLYNYIGSISLRNIETFSANYVSGFLKMGADPNVLHPIANKTPLQMLCEPKFSQHSEVVEAFRVLLNAPDIKIDAHFDDGSTILHRAACMKNSVFTYILVKEHGQLSIPFLDKKDDDGNTALHHALMNMFWGKNPAPFQESILYLLDAGANCNLNSEYGETPLHLILHFKWKIADNMFLDILLNALLKHGADLNALNKENDTPLHLACSNGNCEICSSNIVRLLEAGADCNAKNKGNETPLQLLVETGGEHITEGLKALLSHGAKVNIQKQFTKQTPLYCACKHTSDATCGENVRCLLEARADPSLTDCYGNNCLHAASYSGGSYVGLVFKALLSHHAHSDFILSVNSHRDTALHIAMDLHSRHTNLDWTVLLSENGVNVNSQNMNGQTALHLACEKVRNASDFSNILYLLEKGHADCNIQNRNRETALHVAIRSKKSEYTISILNALLSHGANVDIQNRRGNTALHEAILSELSEYACTLLLEKGNAIEQCQTIQNVSRQTAWEISEKYPGAQRAIIRCGKARDYLKHLAFGMGLGYQRLVSSGDDGILPPRFLQDRLSENSPLRLLPDAGVAKMIYDNLQDHRFYSRTSPDHSPPHSEVENAGNHHNNESDDDE